MQFTTIILAAALSLITGTLAWAPDNNGVWTANNNVWRIVDTNAHESCTHRDTQVLLTCGSFSYWADANGGQFHGTCTTRPGNIFCN